MDPTLTDASLDPNSAIAQALLRSPNYINPSNATPEQVAFLRAQATEMGKPGEARNWAMALGNIANAGVGQLFANRANTLQQGGIAGQNDRRSQLIASLMGQSANGQDSNPSGSAGGGMLGTTPPNRMTDALPAPHTADTQRTRASNSYVDATATAESGGDPTIVNPRSGAGGLNQFLESTWADLGRRHPELGLTPEGRMSGTREGLRQQDAAMTQFTADNADGLRSAGFSPSAPNLQAAHLLGAGGAIKLLGSDPRTPIEAIAGPQAMAANPNWRGMTAGDFYRMASNRVAGVAGVAPKPSAVAQAPVSPPGVQAMAYGPSGVGPDTSVPFPASKPAGASPAPQAGPAGAAGPGQGGSYNAALASALARPQATSGQGLPSPALISALLGSPWATPEDRTMASGLITPKMIGDGLGNQYIYRYGQPPQLVMQGGKDISFDFGSGGKYPGIVTGTMENPRAQVFSPGGGFPPPPGPASNGAASTAAPGNAPPSSGGPPGPNTAATTGPLGTQIPAMAAQAGAIQANIEAQKEKAKADAKEVADSNTELEGARQGGYSLNQMKTVLDTYGGKLPTGPLGTEALWARGLANQLGLGDPKDLAQLEKFNKAATAYAANASKAINPSKPTNFDLETAIKANPGLNISDQGNRILVDHLARVNAMQQQYLLEKQAYYNQHGNTLNGFQQYWDSKADGAGAIPLSRYPVARATKDGTAWIKLPSTDKSGYSWVREDSLK